MKHPIISLQKKNATLARCSYPNNVGKQFVLLTLFLSLLTFSSISAQLPCLGVGMECNLTTDPAVWPLYKCIDGTANFSDLVNQSLLLPPAQAAVTPQRLVVKGVLRNDYATVMGGYTFAPGSDIIFVNETSGINVNTNCKLTLDNTTLRGCQTMWRSVLVEAGATFIAQNNSKFSDANRAISALQNSTISITDCKFQNNFVSINLGVILLNNQVAPINFIPGGGIWGNTIIGGPLKPTYTNRSLVGISIINVSGIQIGNISHEKNSISKINANFGGQETLAGLFISKSVVTVVNSFFTDNGHNTLSSNPRHASISIQNNSRVTFEGLGMENSTIQDSHVGIYLTNSSGDFSQAKLLQNEYDVVYNSVSAMKNPQSLKISNCRFQTFNKSAIYLKSSGGLSLPFSNLEIKSCVFDEDKPEIGDRPMLHFEPSSLTNAKGYVIADNKFYFRFRSINSPISTICILATNLRFGSIVGNEFYNEAGVTRDFIAIQIRGCQSLGVSGNTFYGYGSNMGISSNPINDPEFGIQVVDSPFGKYLCNNFSNLQIGLMFDRICSNSTIRDNTFSSSQHYAIYLHRFFSSLPIEIGKQEWNRNQWINAAVLFEYPGFDQFDFSHVNYVRRSEFIIHNADETSIDWASPVEIDFTDDMTKAWFRYRPYTGPEPKVCEELPDPPSDFETIDSLDISIINGNFVPWRAYAADTWEHSFYLYKRITEHPELITDFYPGAAWYNSQYNGNIGKLSRVLDGFLSLYVDTLNTTGNQLLADLNTISVTTTHEQNLKTWLRIVLEQYIGDAEFFTAQQVTELTAIADQCRTEGGFGVVFARLSLGQSSVRSNECPDIDSRNNKNDKEKLSDPDSIECIITPNPSHGDFNINLNKEIREGQIRLIDIQGRIAGSWTFSGNQYKMNTESLNSGIYLIEISSQGHILAQKKVVIH
ncbi:MAG: T9SS type A sorting domain-containing protein [Chitinophagales bacterium]|nr:T9SS type A sorting domain-containing protein [Chitinophagales bacterium]